MSILMIKNHERGSKNAALISTGSQSKPGSQYDPVKKPGNSSEAEK
ncbi:MAG: hypothetical protein L6461_17520 [Anaerolineae bacterium]|nr:hypothetical protein [Anaerolineae bacterium]